MTLKAMEANYNTLTNDDVIRMLRNTEGKTEFERGLILEAAKRIESIAAAVQAEREASQPLIDALEYIAEVDNDGFAKHTYRNMIKRARAALVAIRARNEEKA